MKELNDLKGLKILRARTEEDKHGDYLFVELDNHKTLGVKVDTITECTT